MTLAEVRDYLKTITTAKRYYIGRLDGKQDKSIGVYALRRPDYLMAIGGREATLTGVKAVSILLHWTSNADETEQAAQDLFDRLLDTRGAVVGGKRVNYFKPLTSEPVDVGTEGDAFERVLEFEIYYERNEENA